MGGNYPVSVALLNIPPQRGGINFWNIMTFTRLLKVVGIPYIILLIIWGLPQWSI
jgi:hypothetical protein